jgi:hypothetical protein
MGSKATTTNFSFWPSFKFFFVYRTLSIRQKTKNHQNQGSIYKKIRFFPQSLSHIPKWVHLVQKTRAKNSHAWAPLMSFDAIWHPVLSGLVSPGRVSWSSSVNL